MRRHESVFRTIVRAGQGIIAAMRMRVAVEGTEHLPPAEVVYTGGAAGGPERGQRGLRVRRGLLDGQRVPSGRGLFGGRGGDRPPRFRPIVPGTGAVVAITHSSLLDFVFAQWAIFPHGRPHLRFMIARKWSGSSFMQAINTWCGHIEVDRAHGAEAYRQGVDALRAGEWVAVFPEGARNRAVRPHALRTGAMRMAAEAGVPVVPVSVFGGGRLLGGGGRFSVRRLWRAPVSVVIGETVEVREGEDAREATERLRQSLDRGISRALEIFPAALPAGAPWVPADAGGGAPTVEEAEAVWHASRAERERRG